MLSIVETGQALYVLAGICVLGIMTRMLTRNLYKRLIRESTNLAAAKNKSLRELRQRAENAYYVNQGMRDTGSWLEHQLGDLHFRGMTLAGWSNISTQLTWLCLLVGGLASFYAYWSRLDTYYIVLYGGGSVLMAMFNMFLDGNMASARHDQLAAVLQDYLENTMFPRMSRASDRMEKNDRNDRNYRNAQEERPNGAAALQDRGRMGVSAVQGTAAADQGYKETERTVSRRARLNRKLHVQEASADSAAMTENQADGRTQSVPSASAGTGPQSMDSGGLCGTDDLKKGLEQIAASRERNRQHQDGFRQNVNAAGAGNTASSVPRAEDLLKELSPGDLRIINEILKQYLG